MSDKNKELDQKAIDTVLNKYGIKKDKPIITQIEKHNLYLYPSFPILLVLDVWEHAYYVDYKNERAQFVEHFWNIVNWDSVNLRIKELPRTQKK